jgi:hypothetical protein
VLSRPYFALIGLTCALNVACSPRRPSATEVGRPGQVGNRTVFTDTMLYREICAEADSGLTPASGRCTPRDQSVLRRPVTKRP